jgi:hypothetical protein
MSLAGNQWHSRDSGVRSHDASIPRRSPSSYAGIVAQLNAEGYTTQVRPGMDARVLCRRLTAQTRPLSFQTSGERLAAWTAS